MHKISPSAIESHVVIGADHAGVGMKKYLLPRLVKAGYSLEDVGGDNSRSGDDYPGYAFKVARHVAAHHLARGILICGTGTGMVIAANKVKGARAAMCFDEYSAKMARADNDANILTLRGRKFSNKKALRIVLVWLKTAFSEEQRHKRRIAKINAYERRSK